ncbi:MAG: glycosyltransferase, partial [Verrucomicrobiaceae bacterium]|nr:glycosyltransferase [Verrucomicrobiaceae bacterium]
MKMRITVAVHGRFHAFDLARALAARSDVEARLLTNYTARECAIFGLQPDMVTSFVMHRWLQRLSQRLMPHPLPARLEAFLHESFGRWARRKLEAMNPVPDVIRIFSGVAAESLRSQALRPALRLVTRGSAHIRTQKRLLEAEGRRAGRPIDMPSAYILAREEQEYALADGVVVLSSFSRESFIQQGYPP